jgi:excisionase family DNA binding protein
VAFAAGCQRETYGKAELRLRVLLFGDGTEVAGRVRGEEFREQARTELRRMRNAFDAVASEVPELRPDEADTRSASLEDDLRRIASSASRPEEIWSSGNLDLMTPAEVASVLRVSVSSVYRAIRNGEIRATRLKQYRGALRIPKSELQRLLSGDATTLGEGQRVASLRTRSD